jgi:hypothetical protein
MSDKPYSEMTADELRAAMNKWAEHVATSPGWTSAYFSAQQCKAIKAEAARRGIEIENPYPIVIGN